MDFRGGKFPVQLKMFELDCLLVGSDPTCAAPERPRWVAVGLRFGPKICRLFYRGGGCGACCSDDKGADRARMMPSLLYSSILSCDAPCGSWWGSRVVEFTAAFFKLTLFCFVLLCRDSLPQRIVCH